MKRDAGTFLNTYYEFSSMSRTIPIAVRDLNVFLWRNETQNVQHF